MAKGKKTGGKDFTPGASGNPSGRPPTPPDVKEAQRLTRAQFIAVASKYIGKTKSEIVQAANDPSTPALEIMMASVISKAITQGDHARLNFILDRLIGKVVDKTKSNNVTEHKFSQMSDEELVRRAKDALELLLSQPEGESN